MEACPLCESKETTLLFARRDSTERRDFHVCSSCDLVFVPREFHVSPDQERERYLTHNNDPDDLDYRAFLSRLWEQLRPRLRTAARGLDFGAGPGPALAAMMKEDGFESAIYDPFFHPERSVLTTTYDFITCTETLEHLRDPNSELKLLDSLLESGGWLGVMTGILDDRDEFPDWYYHRDPTHICFYSEETMRWIANRFRWKLVLPAENVALFRKP